MKRLRDWRPAPGTVLGAIALFVSLGGVSYGFASGSIDSRELKNNTVRTRDLRNNDVRTTDIRNSTITGRDIKTGTIKGSDLGSNTLTGTDVLESSLGTVPSANTANTANFAAVSGATAGLVHTSPVKLNYGQPDKDLFSLNGFRVYLECTLAAGPKVWIQNVSAGNNAATDGNEATENGTPEDDTLNQGDKFIVNGSVAGSPNVDESGEFAAYGSKGAISGSVSTATEIPSTGANCAANGYAVG